MAACGAKYEKQKEPEGKEAEKPTSESGAPEVTLESHLKSCKVDEKKFKKVKKILEGILDKTEDESVLLSEFAKKAYKSEKSPDKAKDLAKTFLDKLFGSLKNLIELGPEKAVSERLRQKNARLSKTPRDAIKPRDAHEEKADDDVPPRFKKCRKFGRLYVGSELGKGGQAVVHEAYDATEGMEVAVKIVDPKYARSSFKEIKILQKLRHRNVVRFYNCFINVPLWEGKLTTAFTLELARGGVLIDYLIYTEKFEPPLARWFMHQLVAGVNYCHQQGIVHRDLKHDNVLLTEDFTLKITDFGMSRFFDTESQMTTRVGTTQYMAPEILSMDRSRARNPEDPGYTESVDIFSMGVMLFLCLAGRQPWRSATPRTDAWYHMPYKGDWEKFFKCHGRRHNFAADAQEIIKGMLAHKAEDRFTCQDIMNCDWYKNKSRYTQKEAKRKLETRKEDLDQQKFIEAKANQPDVRPRALGGKEESELVAKSKAPLYPGSNLPLCSFKTTEDAMVVVQMVQSAIERLDGVVTNVDTKTFAFDWEVKMELKELQLNDSDKPIYASIRGKINVYQMPAEEEEKEDIKGKKSKKKKGPEKGPENVVVFTRGPEMDSRFYFARVYNDLQTHVAFLRNDPFTKTPPKKMKKSRARADDDDDEDPDWEYVRVG